MNNTRDPIDIAREVWPGAWEYIGGGTYRLQASPPIGGLSVYFYRLNNEWLAECHDCALAGGEDLAAVLAIARDKVVASVADIVGAVGEKLVLDRLAIDFERIQEVFAIKRQTKESQWLFGRQELLYRVLGEFDRFPLTPEGEATRADLKRHIRELQRRQVELMPPLPDPVTAALAAKE